MIGYNVSADGKWCLAVGIYQASPGVIAGTMQLYRYVDRKPARLLGIFRTLGLSQPRTEQHDDLYNVKNAV